MGGGQAKLNDTEKDLEKKELKVEALDRDMPTANENNEKADDTKKHLGKVDDVYGPIGDNYQNHNSEYDYSRIGIDVTKKTDKAKCQPGFYMKVHSVG